jgi:hypothetical protein
MNKPFTRSLSAQRRLNISIRNTSHTSAGHGFLWDGISWLLAAAAAVIIAACLHYSLCATGNSAAESIMEKLLVMLDTPASASAQQS